ncbi:unnamed protein product, partial [Linum tenue]
NKNPNSSLSPSSISLFPSSLSPDGTIAGLHHRCRLSPPNTASAVVHSPPPSIAATSLTPSRALHRRRNPPAPSTPCRCQLSIATVVPPLLTSSGVARAIRIQGSCRRKSVGRSGVAA